MSYSTIKRALVGLSSTALVGSMLVITPASSGVAAAAPNCPAVELIEVEGTGASTTNNDPSKPGLVGKAIKERGGADESLIRTWTTPYPATAGVLYQIGMAGVAGWNVQSSVTYGQSRLEGYKRAVAHMEEVAYQCPSTKFALTGYSQGAQVAGDVAEAVSQGKVRMVGPERMVGTVLYGDPGRSGDSKFDSFDGQSSTLYAPMPPGSTLQRGLEVVRSDDGRSTYKNSIGLVGARPHGFAGQQGKVISFCDQNDPACSVPPNSMMRAIADSGNYDTDSVEHIIAAKEAMPRIISFMKIMIAKQGDIARALHETGRHAQAGSVQGNVGSIAGGAAGAPHFMAGNVIGGLIAMFNAWMAAGGGAAMASAGAAGASAAEALGIIEGAVNESGIRPGDVTQALIPAIHETDRMLQGFSYRYAQESVDSCNTIGANAAAVLSSLVQNSPIPWIGDLLNVFLGIDPERLDRTTFGQILKGASMGTSHGRYIPWDVPGKSMIVEGKKVNDWTADYFVTAANNARSGKTIPNPLDKGANTKHSMSDEKSIEEEYSISDIAAQENGTTNINKDCDKFLSVPERVLSNLGSSGDSISQGSSNIGSSGGENGNVGSIGAGTNGGSSEENGGVAGSIGNGGSSGHTNAGSIGGLFGGNKKPKDEREEEEDQNNNKDRPYCKSRTPAYPGGPVSGTANDPNCIPRPKDEDGATNGSSNGSGSAANGSTSGVSQGSTSGVSQGSSTSPSNGGSTGPSNGGSSGRTNAGSLGGGLFGGLFLEGQSDPQKASFIAARTDVYQDALMYVIAGNEDVKSTWKSNKKFSPMIALIKGVVANEGTSDLSAAEYKQVLHEKSQDAEYVKRVAGYYRMTPKDAKKALELASNAIDPSVAEGQYKMSNLEYKGPVSEGGETETEPTKPEETTKPSEPTKPKETSKPKETTKPEETSKPKETTKPSEPTKTKDPKPSTTKKADPTKPSSTKKTEPTKPKETTKPSEPVKDETTSSTKKENPGETSGIDNNESEPTNGGSEETTTPIVAPEGSDDKDGDSSTKGEEMNDSINDAGSSDPDKKNEMPAGSNDKDDKKSGVDEGKNSTKNTSEKTTSSAKDVVGTGLNGVFDFIYNNLPKFLKKDAINSIVRDLVNIDRNPAIRVENSQSVSNGIKMTSFLFDGEQLFNIVKDQVGNIFFRGAGDAHMLLRVLQLNSGEYMIVASDTNGMQDASNLTVTQKVVVKDGKVISVVDGNDQQAEIDPMIKVMLDNDPSLLADAQSLETGKGDGTSEGTSGSKEPATEGTDIHAKPGSGNSINDQITSQASESIQKNDSLSKINKSRGELTGQSGTQSSSSSLVRSGMDLNLLALVSVIMLLAALSLSAFARRRMTFTKGD